MCPCRTLIILFESCVICKPDFLHKSLMEKTVYHLYKYFCDSPHIFRSPEFREGPY